MFERTITVFTLSKSYAMTGWRLGYTVAAEPWMTGLRKTTLYSSNGVSTPTQWAALAAFTTESDMLETNRAAYRERRDLLLAGLNELGLLLRKTCRRVLCLSRCVARQQRQPRGRGDTA